jgi:predicted O-methyltransferase YrrM
VLDRILRGDPRKTSRFRDFEGCVPPPAAWLHLPRSVLSTARFKLTGHRPERPWLGYRGVRRLAGLVRPGTRVLEFGAGMSTVWFARRGAEVTSVEAIPAWHSRVERMLAAVPGHRVTLVLAAPPYSQELLAGREFDLALVDGDGRDSAMEAALACVRPGGHVYLDNADVQEPAHQAARRMALAAGEPQWFTDFTPTQVFVSTGLLVRLRPPP